VRRVDAGWYPDPVARGDHRWWDGESWTDTVSVAGDERTDPEPPPLGSPAGAAGATRRYPGAGPGAAWDVPQGPPANRAPSGGQGIGRARVGAVVAVAALVGLAAGAATGAADDGPDYAGALAADLEARSRGMLTGGEADCVAEGIVAELGEDRLQGLELIGEPDQPWPLAELSDGEERTFATVSYGCVEQQHLVAHLADIWFPVRGRTVDDRTCLSQGYVNALPGVRMREILVALYTREAFEVDDLLSEDELADVADVPAGCGL